MFLQMNSSYILDCVSNHKHLLSDFPTIEG